MRVCVCKLVGRQNKYIFPHNKYICWVDIVMVHINTMLLELHSVTSCLFL